MASRIPDLIILAMSSEYLYLFCPYNQCDTLVADSHVNKMMHIQIIIQISLFNVTNNKQQLI